VAGVVEAIAPLPIDNFSVRFSLHEYCGMAPEICRQVYPE